MGRDHFHIVVLEDNEPDLLMIKRSIQEAGVDCDLTTFTDGAEALTYVKDPCSPIPDLMILDVNVPKVEGTLVLKSVRDNPGWAEVGVLMFTSTQDPEETSRVKMLGANDLLTKPMDLDGYARIGRAVREWLAHKVARSNPM
jgi:chemotaxis family two-component system response regulator Rcp1